MKGDDFEEIDIICQYCGKNCTTWEEVDIGVNEFEIWCYCDECQTDTFHPIKYTSNNRTI